MSDTLITLFITGSYSPNVRRKTVKLHIPLVLRG